jgi:hypothetical protein
MPKPAVVPNKAGNLDGRFVVERGAAAEHHVRRVVAAEEGLRLGPWR